jgi:betaine-aldehyde dehydrogenase
MKLQPQASHFIDGAYVEDDAGKPIDVIYPYTGEVIARLHSATEAVIEQAIQAASRAQKTWREMTGGERGRVLRRAADIMRERNHALSVIETHDTGKPIQETLVADAASGADALEYFGGLAGSLTGEHIPIGGGDFVYTVRQALGVCFGIGAWNYPVQIASWKAAPALACGNSMIFKPSETTPLSALKLAEIFIEAGAPAGLFNVVQGYGDVGAKFVSHPDIAKVSLTGSVPTGKKVAAGAGESLKHVTLELGGKSPIIVFEDADIENALGGAINGNFYSSGQICSNGTRVFVQRAIKEKFLTRLTERLQGVKMGDPMDESVNFGPMTTQAQYDIVLGFIKQGINEGATLVCGGKPADAGRLFIEPTVFADVQDEMTIAREEIFGPVMSVLDFETEEEAVRRANNTEFGLAAGVFTNDLTRAHRVAQAFEAGTCYINTYNLTPVEAPFGGVKNSGVGRENSKAAINHYSEVKSIYVSANDVEAPY